MTGRGSLVDVVFSLLPFVAMQPSCRDVVSEAQRLQHKTECQLTAKRQQHRELSLSFMRFCLRSSCHPRFGIRKVVVLSFKTAALCAPSFASSFKDCFCPIFMLLPSCLKPLSGPDVLFGTTSGCIKLGKGPIAHRLWGEYTSNFVMLPRQASPLSVGLMLSEACSQQKGKEV